MLHLKNIFAYSKGYKLNILSQLHMEDRNQSTQSSDEASSLVKSPTNINPDINSHKSDIISTQNTMDKPCGCGKEGCSL